MVNFLPTSSNNHCMLKEGPTHTPAQSKQTPACLIFLCTSANSPDWVAATAQVPDSIPFLVVVVVNCAVAVCVVGAGQGNVESWRMEIQKCPWSTQKPPEGRQQGQQVWGNTPEHTSSYARISILSYALWMNTICKYSCIWVFYFLKLFSPPLRTI